MDPDSIGWSVVALFVLVAMFAVFAVLSPAMDGPHGSVVTVQQSETMHSGITTDGNTTVVVLSSLWSGVALLATTLCGGGAAGWLVICLVIMVAMVGIAARS